MNDFNNILEKLPHGKDFRFVDKIVEASSLNKTLTASYTIGPANAIVASHFPGFPIWPGVLILEGMAQTAGLLSLYLFKDEPGNSIPLLAKIYNARFITPVLPGATIHYTATIEGGFVGMIKFRCTATIDNSLAAEAKFLAKKYL